MSVEVATSFIAASGAVVLAGASYWFTKRRERDAELRKEKLEHYKAFVASLSGVTNGGTPEGQHAFSLASNNLVLVAPQSVIDAMQRFRDETRTGNPNPSRETHDLLLSKLFLAIRKDLGILPKDNAEAFKVRLWASRPDDKIEKKMEGQIL
jgi:hypothetical protein